MRPTGPKLDRHGFPIPPGFESADAEDSADQRRATRRTWLRGLAKLAVVAVVAAGLWLHFDMNSRVAEFFGMYHARQAVDAWQREDLDAALHQADRALSWEPESVVFLLLRAQIRHADGDVEGALVDVEAALAIKPNDQSAHGLRLVWLHRLRRHEEAAAAASDVLLRRLGDRAEFLNSRAYSRALGGFELEAALADIDEALAEGHQQDNAAFVDTRGYVLLKLGRDEEALAEFDRAIALESKSRDQYERDMKGRNLDSSDSRDMQARQQRFNENLAVMYHHRGEAHEKLGHADEAKSDLLIGEKLGFNPETGVY